MEEQPHEGLTTSPPSFRDRDNRPTTYIKWRRLPDPAGLRGLCLVILGHVIFFAGYIPLTLPSAGHDTAILRLGNFMLASIVSLVIGLTGLVIGLFAILSREGKWAVALGVLGGAINIVIFCLVDKS